MRIIGIDPGIAHTGYAVIECKDQKIYLHHLDIIITSPNTSFPERLKKIGLAIEEVVKKYQPEEASIEDIFFAASPKLALKLGQARGVALYTICKAQVRIYEYTPLKVKEALVGYGRATKDQVRKMAKIILNLKELKVHDDASDALALAICHHHFSQFQICVNKSL